MAMLSCCRLFEANSSYSAICSLQDAVIDSEFNTNYVAATNAGLIRGGYHFAHPDSSSGAAQATYFLAHGGQSNPSATVSFLLDLRMLEGGWSADGITLPGALDLEGMHHLSQAQ